MDVEQREKLRALHKRQQEVTGKSAVSHRTSGWD